METNLLPVIRVGAPSEHCAREFMVKVQSEPQLEYRLFELSLMQDAALAACMQLGMQEMQTLMFRENFNQLSRFLHKAVDYMDPEVRAKIQDDLEAKDYRVAVIRLLKYIKDVRADLGRLR